MFSNYLLNLFLEKKSSSAAGRTRRRLGNTSTCPYVCFNIEKSHHQLFVLPTRRLVRSAADDDFVNSDMVSYYYIHDSCPYEPRNCFTFTSKISLWFLSYIFTYYSLVTSP